ncbi:MAG: hypothetical protein WBO36_07280 [Saprospiraceae bacterium]
MDKFYFYWGWNREQYSRSNISFQGMDYDFSLSKVHAHDRQSKFSFDKYINPSNATIPQYNFRFGYFFKDNYNISIGIDHMKYVLSQDQKVKIDGTIKDERSTYFGDYENEDILLGEDFLKFEHTDGLNFVNLDLRRFVNLWKYKNLNIAHTEGLGVGLLIPRTDATVLGRERHDEFHISGYGVSAVIGLNFRLYRYFFIQTEYKAGFISMQDIVTGYTEADKAQQSFFFSQFNISFGSGF